MKKAYLIAIRHSLTDAAEMREYARKVGPTLAGARPLAAYGRQEVVEGEAVDGVVILEFDNYAAAKAWYDSPAYTDVKTHRLKGGDYSLIITEGL